MSNYGISSLDLYSSDIFGGCNILSNKDIVKKNGVFLFSYDSIYPRELFNDELRDYIISSVIYRNNYSLLHLNNQENNNIENELREELIQFIHFYNSRKTKQLHLVEHIYVDCNCFTLEEENYNSNIGCSHIILHTYKICILQRKWRNILKRREKLIKSISNTKNILYRSIYGKFPKYINKEKNKLFRIKFV